MKEADSVLWDNDPFAVPTTPDRKIRLMIHTYERLRAEGTKPDSDTAKSESSKFDYTYADWLKSNGKA